MKKCIFIIVIIGVCALICDLCQKQWFCNIQYSTEISPVDIVNIAMTAIIAIWLGVYVTRKISEQRFIKEFIISDIYRIEESLTSIGLLLKNNNDDLSVLFDNLHILRTKIDVLDKTSKFANIHGLPIEKLLTEHGQLYVESTDVDGDLVDIEKKILIQNRLNKMTLLLREIICIINNK